MKVSHTSSEYQQGLDGGEISGDDLAVSKSELDRIREDHGRIRTKVLTFWS